MVELFCVGGILYVSSCMLVCMLVVVVVVIDINGAEGKDKPVGME